MAQVTVPKQRAISEETLEHLRQSGASADLIEFTERHVARYSQVDLDRARNQATLVTSVLFCIAIVIVALWPK